MHSAPDPAALLLSLQLLTAYNSLLHGQQPGLDCRSAGLTGSKPGAPCSSGRLSAKAGSYIGPAILQFKAMMEQPALFSRIARSSSRQDAKAGRLAARRSIVVSQHFITRMLSAFGDEVFVRRGALLYPWTSRPGWLQWPLLGSKGVHAHHAIGSGQGTYVTSP